MYRSYQMTLSLCIQVWKRKRKNRNNLYTLATVQFLSNDSALVYSSIKKRKNREITYAHCNCTGLIKWLSPCVFKYKKIQKKNREITYTHCNCTGLIKWLCPCVFKYEKERKKIETIYTHCNCTGLIKWLCPCVFKY